VELELFVVVNDCVVCVVVVLEVRYDVGLFCE